MSSKKLKVGSHVMIYDAPDGKREGVVLVLNDEAENPGKVVGVQFDDFHPVAHECDGLCEKGFGWWTRPENLAVIE